MIKTWCLATALLAAPAILSAETPPAASVPAADTVVARATAAGKLHPCHVEGLAREGRCGTLAVWEDRAAKQGRKIDLNIIVVPATDPNPVPDALFYFSGGPGEGATTEAGGIASLPGLNTHRDLVFIDQRGTGKSNPLRCAFYGRNGSGKAADPVLAAGELFPPDTVRSCKAALEKLANLKLYTSDLGMDDVDEARTWLGYGKIDLFGTSYGTRAAQVFLHRHPDAVRAVVLDGVAPLDEFIPIHHAYAGKRAIDLLLAECAADPKCHAAFPNVHDELAAVMARVDTHPKVAIADPATGKTVTVTANRGLVAEGLRFLGYDTGARQVPLAIHHAFGGDLAPLVKLAMERRVSLDDDLAMGMLFSVTCAEDLPYITDAAAKEAVKDTLLGDFRIAQQRTVCAIWPRGAVPADVHTLVTSSVPVLLFSGERDPVTPPEFGARVAQHLPNSLHLVVPHGSHGAVGSQCANGILLDFLDRGTVKGLDTSCIAQSPAPQFAVHERVPIQLGAAQIDRYTGRYQLTDGTRVLLTREGGQLLIAREDGGSPLPLESEKDGTFYADAFDIELEVAHADDGKGPISLRFGSFEIKGQRIP